MVQKVTWARVRVGPEVVGEIGPGLCALVGVGHDDDEASAAKLADKLYGDTARGRRPSWIAAARPEHAEPLIDAVVERLRSLGAEVATGRFRTEMLVELGNDGQVTLVLDT